MRPKKLFVSVVVPTFNRSGMLCEALQSVLDQTRKPDEIIVIDDGSTDDTQGVLAGFGAKVRVFRRPNEGKSAALNFALEKVHGDVVWIFDDDDIAVPTALETLEGLLLSQPEADIAYGRHERFRLHANGKTKFLGTGHWSRCKDEEFLVETMHDMFAHQPGMLVRKSLYDRVGDFDETLNRSMDYEMLVRLARAGKAVSTNNIVFHQRVHTGERGSRDQSIAHHERTANWIKHDQKIFSKLYAEMTLESYARSPGGKARRENLLSRGSVMASKKLWHLATRDFIAAASISDAPLTQAERAVLKKAMSSKYGVGEMFGNEEVLAALAELADMYPVGPSMVAALSNGLNWRLRKLLLSAHLVSAMRIAGLKIALIKLVISARAGQARQQFHSAFSRNV